MSTKKVSLILACMLDGGIGHQSSLPWSIPEEMKKFRKITTKCSDPDKINAVIMGRQTWESLSKPLTNRLNIILTSDIYYSVPYENTIVLHSISRALLYCDQAFIENIFIIGGAKLYNLFLESSTYFGKIDKIYLSMMFYNPNYIADKFIVIENIFKNFYLTKDQDYQNECDDRLFASFICRPKSHFYNSNWHKYASM